MIFHNLNFDVLTVLQNKLEALEAYKQYVRDAKAAGDEQCQQLFQDLHQEDERHAERLWAQLSRLVQMRGLDEDIDEAATTPTPLKTPGGL
jgi:bacterioferritin (cytochrome b1)